MLALIISIISIFVVVGVSTTVYVQAAKQRDLYNQRLSEVVGKTNSANQYEFEKNKEQEVSLERVRGDVVKMDGQIVGINKNLEHVKAEYGGKIADMSNNMKNVNQSVTKTLGDIQNLAEKQTDSIAVFRDTLGKTTGEVRVLNDKMAIVNGKLVNIGEKQQTAINDLLEDTISLKTEHTSLRDYVYQKQSETASAITSQNNTIAGYQTNTTNRLGQQDEEIKKAFSIAKSVQNIVTTLNTAIENIRMKFNDYVSKTDILRYATKDDLSGVNANFGNYLSTTDFNDYKSSLPMMYTTQEMNQLVQSFVTDSDIQAFTLAMGEIQSKVNEITAVTNALGGTYATKQDLMKLSGDVSQETVNIAGLYTTLTSLQSGLTSANSLIMDVKQALDAYKLQVPQDYASKTYVDTKLTALETTLGSLLSNTKTLILDGLTVNSSLLGTGDIKLNNIAFSKNQTDYTLGGTDRAEIANDISSHKKLLLIGNKSAGGSTGKREVGVWDNLTVSGTTSSTGKISGPDIEATGNLMIGANGSKGYFKSDGTGFVSGNFGVGVAPTDAMFNAGKKQVVMKGTNIDDWQLHFQNTNGGRNIYMNHGIGNGIQINTNDSLGTTYALQTNSTAGKTFEVMNDGKTNVYGKFRVGDTNSKNFTLDLGTTGVGSTRSAYIAGTANNVEINNQENGDLLFSTNNAERLRLKATGDVNAKKSFCLNDVCFNNTEWNLLKAQISAVAKITAINVATSHPKQIYTTGANQARSFSPLPAKDQTLDVFYTVAGTSGVTVNPDYSVSFVSKGLTQNWTIALTAGFAPAIMSENNLTPKSVVINVNEKLLTAITVAATFSQNITSTAVGESFSFTNLPTSDQGLAVTYTVASNDASGMTPTISGSTVSYKALGVTGTKTISLMASFASTIMTETGLAAKAISLTINETAQLQLYAFTSHTFTNAGVTGMNGPGLAQCRSAYSSAAWAQDTTNNYLNMTTNGIQLWTVPRTGTYRFKVIGASGGTSFLAKGGLGAIIEADVQLSRGQILKILIGQGGIGYNTCTGSHGSDTGGGGGTFVTLNDNTPVLIAGGGGGVSNAIGNNGVLTRTGGSASGTYGSPTNRSGGSDGSGGQSGYGASGAGLLGNGSAPEWGSIGTVAQSFINGGQGGNSPGSVVGGFGGGAGAHGNCCISGGGGGGYSGGGAGGHYCNQGGGGGSFILTSATNVKTSTGTYDSSSTFNSNPIVNLGVWNTSGTSGAYAPSGSVAVTFIA